MMAALDLGCHEFRSLRYEGDHLVARRLPTVYAVLDDEPLHRRLLDQSGIPFASSGGALVVIGDSAIEMSKIVSRPIVPLFTKGVLAESDPIGRQVCAWLIELLLPPAQTPHELCVVSLPAGETVQRGQGSKTAQFLEHVVHLLGYDTSVMNPATALSLAELEAEEFSGVCLTVGAESVTFSLTRHSHPLIEARFKQGVNDIIERYAHGRNKFTWDQDGNSYLDIRKVNHWLANGGIDLNQPLNDDEAWMRAAFEELLLSAWFAFKRMIDGSHESILKTSQPFVVSGAVSQLKGFNSLVTETLKLSGVSLIPKSIRAASSEPYSVCRGLLIQSSLSHSTVDRAA